MSKIMPVGSLSCLQATHLLSVVSSQHSLAPHLSLVLPKQVFWLRPYLRARIPSEETLSRRGMERVPNHQELQAPLELWLWASPPVVEKSLWHERVSVIQTRLAERGGKERDIPSVTHWVMKNLKSISGSLMKVEPSS